MEIPLDPQPRARYLPDWSEHVFVLLDATHRWAGAISAELTASRDGTSAECGQVVFETCTTVRQVSDLCDAPNVAGLILFFAGFEREVLGLLRTIWNRRPGIPILMICERKHHDLIPVILESGVSCVLTDITSDLAIARWCLNISGASRKASGD
ncbi:MAG: hypothetical protein NXI04_22410 [Planctomycetaceae bacterium]|nr:hypothetical protein [Planctomycetaceae bacterium]